MIGLKCLQADPCIDNDIIEEEQAPIPPPDPGVHKQMPWETGQTSSCNDFLPPARDVAANVDRTSVKPAPQ